MVYRVLPNDTYKVVDLQRDTSGRRYSATSHVSQLKSWKPPTEDTGLTSSEIGGSEDNSTNDSSAKYRKFDREEDVFYEESVTEERKW